MSLPLSVGDAIAVASFVIDTMTSLKASGGSATEQQELVLELHSLQSALEDMKHLQGSPRADYSYKHRQSSWHPVSPSDSAVCREAEEI